MIDRPTKKSSNAHKVQRSKTAELWKDEDSTLNNAILER